MYVYYRHRQNSGRELVLRDGAQFPNHLHIRDWYIYGAHSRVNGRTEADIEMLGYCDRSGSDVTFGRRVGSHSRLPMMRRPTH
jgi:hypothetical protein